MSDAIEKKPLALLVEDEEAVAPLLTTFLENKGYDVKHVETVVDAKKALVEHDPAIMVTDYGLLDSQISEGDPVSQHQDTGVHLIVKARKDNPLLPIMMVTGRKEIAEEALDALGVKAGTVPVCAKPVNSLVFNAALDQAKRAVEVVVKPPVAYTDKTDGSAQGAGGSGKSA